MIRSPHVQREFTKWNSSLRSLQPLQITQNSRHSSWPSPPSCQGPAPCPRYNIDHLLTRIYQLKWAIPWRSLGAMAAQIITIFLLMWGVRHADFVNRRARSLPAACRAWAFGVELRYIQWRRCMVGTAAAIFILFLNLQVQVVGHVAPRQWSVYVKGSYAQEKKSIQKFCGYGSCYFPVEHQSVATNSKFLLGSCWQPQKKLNFFIVSTYKARLCNSFKSYGG